LVGGAARVAGLAARRDWSASISPTLDGLDQTTRVALAERWTAIALMEHASIAAFSRFALELLGMGAPPELLLMTQAAMLDETVHARDAFALASAYAGRAVGPGALDSSGALADRSPLDVVRTAILEGCIGETVAAVEAAEAVAHATDPTVRQVLERVTVDETRHAELAWRFLRWVLEHGDPELRNAAVLELATVVESECAASRAASIPAAGYGPALREHGIIEDSARIELRGRILAEIIAPCAQALAATASPGLAAAA
jgi:hypothetical protein